ncbi:RHS repeat-associated core domain-containing protein [Bradyrhizobium sp. RP6]|uniref:RHS repeat-associated core domain-containing protein n=1 Tax=Bradyrhizobium sp. RP6 TaxID=2489596 RepID=UPI0018F6EB38|nr:RHS repeat-associated core domain-containing protein [Bradyrhizobium sp. RP6]
MILNAAQAEEGALVSCERDNNEANSHEIYNVTAGCKSYSILVRGTLAVEFPFDPKKIPSDVPEHSVQLLKVASSSGDVISSMEFYLDRENRTTIATLKDESGRFINGVLKQGDQTEKVPSGFEPRRMASVKEANVFGRIPMVSRPNPSPTGELRLSFPLVFPGVREGLRPSVSIEYGSNSGYGQLGEGWSLITPTISVDTRWGVPVFDPNYETETYLFNGEQLIAERPESNEETGIVYLADQPHRAKILAKRQSRVSFVLRRDSGNMHFVRHGSSPDEYWWEGWQETGDSQKIMFFGKAPGRRYPYLSNPADPLDIEQRSVRNPNAPEDQIERELALTRGPASHSPASLSIPGLPRPERAQMRWVLGRESDPFGNTIDYEWQSDCILAGGANQSEPLIKDSCWDIDPKAIPSSVFANDLYLRRITYGSSSKIDQDIESCRISDSPICKKQLAVYEFIFSWSGLAQADYARSNARSGGLVVSGRRLDQISSRLRRNNSDTLAKLDWLCSDPFFLHRFIYKRDELVSSKDGGEYLLSHVRTVTSDHDLIPATLRNQAGGLVPASFTHALGACAEPSLSPDDKVQAGPNLAVTRFEYDNSQFLSEESYSLDAGNRLTSAGLPPATGAIRDLFSSDGKRNGPFAPNANGSVGTSELGGSIFLGIGFGSEKRFSVGVKGGFNRRLTYSEMSTVADLTGDGIPDLVTRGWNGGFEVYVGKIDAKNGQLSFEATAADTSGMAEIPALHQETQYSSDNVAVEAHFPRGYAAGFRSWTQGVQNGFLIDMDGDKKLDVVVGGTIFYNRSTFDGQKTHIVFTANPPDPMVGFRTVDEKGASSVQDQPVLPLARDEIKKAVTAQNRAPRSIDYPRLNTLRAWKAPFGGQVRISGPIDLPRPDGLAPIDGQDVRTPEERKEASRIDGVIVSVQRSSTGPAGHPKVDVCAEASLALTEQSRTPTKTLPEKLGATFNGPGSCLDTSAGEPTPPTGLVASDELIVSVAPGDVLYFAVDPVNNGNADIVEWNPRVDYLWLYETILDGASSTSLRRVIYGYDQAADLPGLDAVKISLSRLNTRCSGNSDIPVTRSGIPGTFSEQMLGLCDRWGRSIVRYIPAEEQNDLAVSLGSALAPYSGRFGIEGVVRKPSTLFGARLILQLRHRAEDGHVKPCNSRDEADTRIIVEFSAAEETKDIAKDIFNRDDWPVAVERGALVCMFWISTEPRISSDRSTIGAGAWPEDLSQVVWDAPLRIAYRSKLLVTTDPALALPPKGDKLATGASDAEKLGVCIDPGSDWMHLPTPKGAPAAVQDPDGKSHPYKFVCYETKDAFAVMPKVPVAFNRSVADNKDPSTGPRADRPVMRVLPVVLPETEEECLTNGQAGRRSLYRLQINPTTLTIKRPPGEATSDDLVGSLVSAFVPRDPLHPSDRNPELFATFKVISRASGEPVKLRPEHLLGKLAPEERIVFDKRTTVGGGFEVNRSLMAEQLVRRTSSNGLTQTTVTFDEFIVGPREELPTDITGYQVCHQQPIVLHVDTSGVVFRFKDIGDADLIASLAGKIASNDFIYLSRLTGISEQRVDEVANLLMAAGYNKVIVSREAPRLAIDVETVLRPVADSIPPSPAAPSQMQGGSNVEVMKRESFAILDSRDCAALVPGTAPVCPLTKSVVLTSSYASATKLPAGAVEFVESPHFIFAPRDEWASPQSSRGWSNLAVNTEYDLSVPTVPEPKSLALPTPGAVPLPDFATILHVMSDAGAALSANGDVRSACGALNASPAAPPSASASADCAQSSHYKALVAVRAFPLVPQWRQASGAGETCIANDQKRNVADAAGSERAFTTLPSIVPVAPMRAYMGESDAGTRNSGRQVSAGRDSCSMGPDSQVWISGSRVSASRLGAKDITDRVAELASETAESIYPTPPGGGAPSTTVAAVRQIALPKSTSFTTDGYSVGVDPGLLSESRTTVSSSQETLDVNGDGYPDQVNGQSILLSDPLGNYRCTDPRLDTWSKAGSLCLQPWTISNPSRASDAEALQLGSFTAPKSATVSQPEPNATNGSSSVGAPVRQAVRQTEPHFGFQPPAISFGDSASLRQYDWIDINGDGLPDRIITACSLGDARAERCDLAVSFNLGYAFGPPQILGSAPLERSLSIGLGVGAGFSDGDDRNEYGGGINASLSASKLALAFVDVNGDGLPDLVAPRTGDSCTPATIRSFPTQLCAKFNLGRGFTDWKPLAETKVPLLGSGGSETDNMSGGAWFSLAFGPLFPTPLFIIVNPGAGLTETTSRQVVQLRDVDGDGLPEIVVSGGLSNGQFNLNFDNTKNQVFHNGLGKRSLLSRVFLPTNPREANLPANFEFNFARAGNTQEDPITHWVLSEVIARDGVVQDDQLGPSEQNDPNLRRTCLAYGGGYFDKYEKRFLGFAKVRIVEGCQTRYLQRPLLQRLDAGGDAESLSGTRRIDRTFGNRTVFDSGLLLAEMVTVADSRLGWEPQPRRETRNHYVLIDLRARHPDRFNCFATSSGREGPALVSSSTLDVAKHLLQNIEGGCSALPALDPTARHLAPFVAEVVRTTRETNSGKSELKSLLRMRPDFRGRVVKACDLGDPENPADDVCSEIDYYDSLASDGRTQNQLQVLIHYERLLGDEVAATPQFSLVRNLVVKSARGILRRRSALYHLENGQLLKLCRFLNPLTSTDPCDPVKAYSQQPPRGVDFPSVEMLFPTSAKELLAANDNNVAMDVFAYDTRGNLAWALSPTSGFSLDPAKPATNRHYIAKRWRHDVLLQRVARSESAVICAIDTTINTDVPMADRNWSNLPCLPGSASVKNVQLPNGEGKLLPFGDAKAIAASQLDEIPLGTVTAYTLGIDYRFATATVSVDVNSNAIYTPLDGFGRAKAVSATFGDLGPRLLPPRQFEELPANLEFRELASYEYRHWGVIVTPASGHSGPLARISVIADPKSYRSIPGRSAPNAPYRTLVTDVLFDQFGLEIQKQSDDENCQSLFDKKELKRCEFFGATVSGVITRDSLERQVAEFMPMAAERSDNLNDIRYLSPPSIDPTSGEAALRTKVDYDGLDRPTLVTNLDGNTFQFGFWIDRKTFADGSYSVHRSVATNAVCSPVSIERDARGNIRSIEEYWQDDATKKTGDIDAQALGSAFDEGKLRVTLGAGWLKGVSWDRLKVQQRSECEPLSAIAQTLQAGKVFGKTRVRSARVEYQYDPLNNPIAVVLPRKEDTEVAARNVPLIRMGYDALGRRIWTDDPDRGFEARALDLVGNAICARSGLHPKFDPSLAPEAYWLDRNCNLPSYPSAVLRVAKSEFLFKLPARIAYTFIAKPVSTDQHQTIVMQYGPATDEMKRTNLVGRLARIDDLVGTELRAYDAVGHRALTARRIRDLKDRGRAVAELVIKDGYDVWSSLKKKSLSGYVVSLGDSTKKTEFDEQIEYEYTAGGRLASLATRTNPPAASKELKILLDARYDERGNRVYAELGNSVTMLRRYDPATNRLLNLTSRLPSVSCRESSTGDDCSAFPPAVDFQSVSYTYDAQGNVLQANNTPVYAAPCRAPGGDGFDCAPVLDANAREIGLLIRSNRSNFAYDQLNRVRSVEHQMNVYSGKTKLEKDAIWNSSDIANAKARILSFNERLAYANTHELRQIARNTTTSDPSGTTLAKANSTLVFAFGARPEHAPTTAHQTGGRSWEFEYDGFGRQKARRTDGGETRFDWQVDDFLAGVSIELPISESERKRNVSAKRSIVKFEHDMAGGRAIKAGSVRTEFKNGQATEVPLGDTVYLADVLTVARAPNKKPEVMVQLAMGSERLASYWAGDQVIFSYHPILANRSVNDVVVGNISKPQAARIFQQFEYSGFGEMIHSRSSLIGRDEVGAAERRSPRIPAWRFDSKEADVETGLMYFGARYYDPALALWLNPDPKMAIDSASAATSLGRFASYSFAAQNPIAKIDPTGREPERAGPTSSIFGSVADEHYYTDDHWVIFNPRVDVFWFLGLVGRTANQRKVEENLGGYAFRSYNVFGGDNGRTWEGVSSYDIESKISVQTELGVLKGLPKLYPTASIIAAADTEGEAMGGIGIGASTGVKLPYFRTAKADLGVEGFGLVGNGRYAAGLLAHGQIGPVVGGAGADVESQPEWGGKSLRLIGSFNREFMAWVGQLMGPRFGDGP